MKIVKEKIFTNGAFLELRKLENGKYAWVVVGFEDDSYCNGEIVYPLSIPSKKIEDMQQYICKDCDDIFYEEDFIVEKNVCKTCNEREYDVEVSGEKGYFEHKEYGEEIGGELIFENKTLVDFDGCQILPEEVANTLIAKGYTVDKSSFCG